MQKIMPYLWFENQAEEAAQFYSSVFSNVKIGRIMRYDEASSIVSGMPVGSVMAVEFEIEGYMFGGLNGGPMFKFTPAISFAVNCASVEEVDRLWSKLSEGGQVLMELDKYPFSERYGWLNDKYGVSWQLNIGERRHKIAPCFLFTGDKFGRAAEAINNYVATFKDSGIDRISLYEADDEDEEGAVKYSLFRLGGQEFIAMESSLAHKFSFTPAVSLLIDCRTQEEVDELWEKLSAVKEAEQCGWVQDKFGVSWQIVPDVLDKYLTDPDPVKAKRVMEAMLEMHKLSFDELKRAYEGSV